MTTYVKILFGNCSIVRAPAFSSNQSTSNGGLFTRYPVNTSDNGDFN